MKILNCINKTKPSLLNPAPRNGETKYVTSAIEPTAESIIVLKLSSTLHNKQISSTTNIMVIGANRHNGTANKSNKYVIGIFLS